MAVCIQAYTAHQKYNREQRHYEFFSIVKPVLNTCCILIFFHPALVALIKNLTRCTPFDYPLFT